MAALVELDPDLDEKVAKLKAPRAKALAIAESIAERARETAPKGTTGDYEAGIVVQETKFGARVVATDPKSAIEEFGAPRANQPGRFILRNAAASLGLKFKKRGS
jgi:hypothetical protein